MASLKKPASRYFVLALAGLTLVGGASVTSGNVYSNIKTYNRILANVYDKYVEEVDSKDLIYASIEGMMQALDPHSAFLEKKEYDDLMVETQGKYGGVGISIDIRDDWLTVVSPIEGTPAFKLGIQAGDRIVAIEGESTKGITTSQAAKLLRGRKGTSVHITIQRKGDPQPFDVEIVRDVIELKSVPYHGIVRDGIGYLRLARFSEDSGKEVETALSDLLEQGARGIVFDLRWNHGGLLTQAVAVSDKFLERGRLISYTQGRNTADRNEYHASERPVLPADVHLVVLVNGATASASEIVAGAVQDDGRAIILGELTYGKGLVQTLIPLDSEASLKLTTAKWYTPSGRCIQRDSNSEPEEDAEVALEEAETRPSVEKPEEEPVTGGIQPDVIVKGETTSRYGVELLRQNHFFRFAVDYTTEHPDIPMDFRATDDVIQAFASYLDEQAFDYETAAEMEVKRLRELAEEEEYDATTLQAVDLLASRLEGEKDHDFGKNREYIEFGIEREIMSKVHGTVGLYSVILRSDNQAQAAVDLLSDEKAYRNALQHKEAIAAVGDRPAPRPGGAMGSVD
jgi:carboxyl-terminal processing protease